MSTRRKYKSLSIRFSAKIGKEMGCWPSVPEESREFSANRRAGDWALTDWLFFLSYRRNKYDRHIDRLAGIATNVRTVLKHMNANIQKSCVELEEFQAKIDGAKGDTERRGWQLRYDYMAAQVNRMQEICARLETFNAFMVRAVSLDTALVCMKDLDQSAIASMSKSLLEEGTKNIAELFAVVTSGEEKFKETFDILNRATEPAVVSRTM